MKESRRSSQDLEGEESPWTGPAAEIWLEANRAASAGRVGDLESPAIFRQVLGVAPDTGVNGRPTQPLSPVSGIPVVGRELIPAERLFAALDVWDRNDWKAIRRARLSRWPRRMALRILAAFHRMMPARQWTAVAPQPRIASVPFRLRLTSSQQT